MLQKTIQIANFLLILTAIYFGVNGFYTLVKVKLEHSGLILPSGNPMTSSPLKKNQPRISDYHSIIKRDLFKTEAEIKHKFSMSPSDIDLLKQTDLKLKLWGTVSTEKEKSDHARAVIEDTQSREQGLYKVGDTIQIATIKAIFRNSVIIDVNGMTEKLLIDEENPGARKPPAFPQPAISEINTPESLPHGAVSLKRSQIDDALKNINTIMREVRIEPVYKDGKPDGVMLANIESTSILKKMGLRIGDVITGVNGRKIDSVDNALSFYESLASGDKLSLELKRRGRPTTMDIVIE